MNTDSADRPFRKLERPTDAFGNPVEWVTPPMAAKLAGLSIRTIRNWINKGLLPHHRRVSGRIFINVADLENAL